MTQEVSITTSLLTAGEPSRALFEDENGNVIDETQYVTRYLFLLYDGTEATSELQQIIEIDLDKVVMPYYTELPKLETGAKWFAVMLANVRATQLGAAGNVKTSTTAGSTLESLYSATYDINATDNKPTDPESFTWSGFRYVTPDTRSIHFILNPNVAKVSVSVANNTGETSGASDDIQIVNIQVKNVPPKARFAQNALSKAGLFTHEDNATGITGEYIDYEIETLELAKGESTAEPLQWFIPHNETGAGTRPNGAPSNATYIEVDGIRRLDFMDTAYKIYPSRKEYENGVAKAYNDLDSFNIMADHQYGFTMSITDDGLKYESNNNVTDKTTATTGVDKVKLPYNSNSYMIHPLWSMSANGTLYELPINRINEYWVTYGKDASMQVTDATQWEADVIWQDIPGRAIYFADKDGNVDKTSTVFSGTGVTPIYFKLVNQATDAASQTYGNVLIGVRKKGETTYLWSWHLWITDYNPDAALPYSVAKNYKTGHINAMMHADSGGDIDKQNPVGNVQHYTNNKHSYWSNFVTSHAAWNNSDGIYANSWIMDRNLGAQDVAGWDKDMTTDYMRTKVFGMYYQYGRKDPFPYSQYIKGTTKITSIVGDRKVYDINGNQVWWTFDEGTTPRTIKDGVQNPDIYIMALEKTGVV